MSSREDISIDRVKLKTMAIEMAATLAVVLDEEDANPRSPPDPWIVELAREVAMLLPPTPPRIVAPLDARLLDKFSEAFQEIYSKSLPKQLYWSVLNEIELWRERDAI